jgi:small subunit ribosomal protein S2
MSAQLGAAGVDMGAMEVLMAEEEAAGAAGQETAAADA